MKTHQMHSNRSSMWLAESPAEARSQIAIFLSSLGDGKYEYFSINRVPDDTEYDEFPDADEWIQAGGSGDDGGDGELLVEIRRLDSDGVFRLYVVGRRLETREPPPVQQVNVGDDAMTALENEVLSLDEALEIFTFYYDRNTVPDGWNLRMREEYSRKP